METAKSHEGMAQALFPLGGTLKVELSPNALQLVTQLVNKTGDDLDDDFRKALALYTVAVDAHQDGKAVGAATSPDVLETEFVGF